MIATRHYLPAGNDFALYRHFSANGALLYVGQSVCPLHRQNQHRCSPWFVEIARIEIERFPTRDELDGAEKAAIKRERPLYNVTHNTGGEVDEECGGGFSHLCPMSLGCI